MYGEMRPLKIDSQFPEHTATRTHRNAAAAHIIPDYATLVRYDNVKLFFCRNLLRK